MSVLIKGMELPKDCPYCQMSHYNASDEFTGCAVVPCKRYAMHNDAVYAKSTQRPDWCPLIEIPEPHGRLIDADRATAESIKRTGKRLLAIDTAPTVIEAEGSENHDD